MKPLRLVIVIKRFWPLTGPTETAACSLASELRRIGHYVEVLTISWQKNWPQHFQFREFEVQRIGRSSLGPFASFRFARALSRKLDAIQPDAVFMYGLGEELSAVRKTLGDRVRIIVRADGRLLAERKSQKRISLELADQVICDTQYTANRLQELSNGSEQMLSVLPDGVEFHENQTRSVGAQSRSRLAISDAHPVLRIEPDQPLVVTSAPMDNDFGLLDLVESWKVVVESYPQAKLWIFGDGPKGRQVWDAIVDANLVYSIIMPGFFDSYCEIIQAADLYVHATRRPTNCSFLYKAFASGLCVVATESSLESLTNLKSDESREPGSNVTIQKEVNGIVAPAMNPKALGEAILLGLREKELRTRLGEEARSMFADAIDIQQLAPQYLAAAGLMQQPEVESEILKGSS